MFNLFNVTPCSSGDDFIGPIASPGAPVNSAAGDSIDLGTLNSIRGDRRVRVTPGYGAYRRQHACCGPGRGARNDLSPRSR